MVNEYFWGRVILEYPVILTDNWNVQSIYIKPVSVPHYICQPSFFLRNVAVPSAWKLCPCSSHEQWFLISFRSQLKCCHFREAFPDLK